MYLRRRLWKEEEEKPKVSVIMGIHNGGEKLEDTILSIVAQTFKKWEFIICDDASTDDTWETLVEWSQKEPRIVLLRNETELGRVATFNKCLERASGSYVVRVDNENYSYPWRLRAEHDFLDINTIYAFVSGQVNGEVIVKGKKNIIEDFWHRKEFPKKKDFLIGPQYIPQAAMFRRIPLQKAGGYRIAPETKGLEDYDLFMRLYAMGYIGCNLRRPLLRCVIEDVPKTYMHYIHEVKVRFQDFKKLKLLHWGFPFIFIPLFVGLVPRKILWKIKIVDKKRVRRMKRRKKIKNKRKWDYYLNFWKWKKVGL